MERALATLSIGSLIAWTSVVIIVLAITRDFINIFQPWALLFLLLPAVLPTLCTSLWLLRDKRPSVPKLGGVIAIAVTILLVGQWLVYLGTDDEISRTYVSLLYFPIAGGALCACVAYYLGAKLPKPRRV